MGTKNKEINDIAEKLFIKKSGALLSHTDQNAAGNAAVVENCFALAQLFVKIRDEKNQETTNEQQ